MLAAGFELLSPQAQPVLQHTCHKGVLLLRGVTLAASEEQPLIGALYGPCAHGKAKLNIRFYLPGMSGAIEQTKLDGAFGKKGVEVEAIMWS